MRGGRVEEPCRGAPAVALLWPSDHHQSGVWGVWGCGGCGGCGECGSVGVWGVWGCAGCGGVGMHTLERRRGWVWGVSRGGVWLVGWLVGWLVVRHAYGGW